MDIKELYVELGVTIDKFLENRTTGDSVRDALAAIEARLTAIEEMN